MISQKKDEYTYVTKEKSNIAVVVVALALFLI
jgi:hypothetical protein